MEVAAEWVWVTQRSPGRGESDTRAARGRRERDPRREQRCVIRWARHGEGTDDRVRTRSARGARGV